MHLEKILAKQISDKGLEFRIYKKNSNNSMIRRQKNFY